MLLAVLFLYSTFTLYVIAATPSCTHQLPLATRVLFATVLGTYVNVIVFVVVESHITSCEAGVVYPENSFGFIVFVVLYAYLAVAVPRLVPLLDTYFMVYVYWFAVAVA